MKIGLDLHGVIDKFTEIFIPLTEKWVFRGDEVHILTGQPFMETSKSIEGISYTHFFSIVDHHQKVGTSMWNDDPRGKGWWMERDVWMRTKGQYAKGSGLDIHFDDSLGYAEYFPSTCTFVWVQDSINEVFKL